MTYSNTSTDFVSSERALYVMMTYDIDIPLFENTPFLNNNLGQSIDAMMTKTLVIMITMMTKMTKMTKIHKMSNDMKCQMS